MVNALLASDEAVLRAVNVATPDELAWVQLTPRYHTSAHVVFIVMRRDTGLPTLVVKAAKTRAGFESLVREAGILRRVQAVRPQGFDTVPRVIACKEFNGTRVLVETGLDGRPLTGSVVRRRFDACRGAVERWVSEFHGATIQAGGQPGDAFAEHAAGALAALERVLGPEHAPLLERTHELLRAALGGLRVPRVFEHGDLCAPNLLLAADGSLQVVDWELACADGLPYADLAFALAYLSRARRNAQDGRSRAAAFREAFTGPAAWGAAAIRRYQRGLGLEAVLARPLFLLTWVRYAARLLERWPEESGKDGTGAGWSGRLAANQYFQYWRQSVDEYDRLAFE